MLETQAYVPLQVSKWVKISLLCDHCEMEDLILNHLPAFNLYDTQRVVAMQEGVYSSELLIDEYGRYVRYLKEGLIPNQKEFRALFSMAWSLDEEAICMMPTQDERRLLKAVEPIVQTQMNEIHYSSEEKAFRVQIYGSGSISWGIQVGFPHLFMDPSTCASENTGRFPNRKLFSAFQRWIRSHTVPTPFIVNGQRMNSPIRLGKSCFSWIARHPQLIAQEIQIERT